MILVTGCAGFIGSKIVEFLLERGDSVIGIDNLSDDYSIYLKEWRLKRFHTYPAFEFKLLDITDLNALNELFQKHRFDTVMNLAARAGVRPSVKNPWIYVQTNIVGSLNLLEMCKEFGIRKLLMASTASVYGKNDLPFREDDRTDFQLSPYSASKKGAEAIAYAYHHLYKFDIAIPRYFTVYGPAGRPNMSVLIFIHRIAEGLPINIYGDGTQKRDFTYIDDIARGSIDALKQSGFEVINLGSDHPVSINYLIQLIENCLGKKAKIDFLPRNSADVFAMRADISKASKLLGWRPQTSIEEGIIKTVEWYLENRVWLKDSVTFGD